MKKEILLIITVLTISLFGIGYMTHKIGVEIDTTIKEQGGVEKIIINIGRKVKSISDEIQKPGAQN